MEDREEFRYIRYIKNANQEFEKIKKLISGKWYHIRANNIHTLRNDTPHYCKFNRCLDDDMPEMQYTSRVPTHTALHWGQLKLLLSELELLTIVYEHMLLENKLYLNSPRPSQGDMELVNRPVCIYIGAAGGHHHPLLHEFFPQVDWVLIDPAPFFFEIDNIKTQELKFENKRAEIHRAPNVGRIIIINDYFTEEMAEELKKEFSGRMIVFLSDIRRSYSKALDHEINVHKDNLFQIKCGEILGAEWCFFKFRTPFIEIDGSPIISYPNGVVMYQTREGETSSETRYLYRANPDKKREFNFNSYGDKLFRFNSVERANLYSHGNKTPGMDKCYDCAAEEYIYARAIQIQHKLLVHAGDMPAVCKPIKLTGLTDYIHGYLEDKRARPFIVAFNNRKYVLLFNQPKVWYMTTHK